MLYWLPYFKEGYVCLLGRIHCTLILTNHLIRTYPLFIRGDRVPKNGCFFWKKSNRPLTPPPPSRFLDSSLRFFAKIRKYALSYANLQWFFLDLKWPPPPLSLFLDMFYKIYYQNIPSEIQKICEIFCWIENDPPPLPIWTFSKKTSILGTRSPPLQWFTFFY